MEVYLEEYFGLECPHCQRMQELSKKIEKEIGVTINRFEVWHDYENMKKVEELDPKNECGGVPFFINKKTGKTLCGEVSEKEMRDWALGK